MKQSTAQNLLKALKDFIAIVEDSYGVSGYHLNGDIEPWDGGTWADEIASAYDAIREAEQ